MAVIDLRGSSNNPWAQFLPKIFQTQVLMGIENKFAIERLKAKAIQDAGIKAEDRKYAEEQKKKDREYQEQQDIEKFNRELEGKRSEAAIQRFYKPTQPKIVTLGDKAYRVEGKNLVEVASNPKPPTETPEQRRAANLKIKKDFEIWKRDLDKKMPKPEAGLNANQRRVLDQALADAGATILNNAESEAVKPHIEFVNKYLTKEPYIYTWTTTKGFWGEKQKAVRVDLPPGLSAADIKYTAKKNNETIEEHLMNLGLIEK